MAVARPGVDVDASVRLRPRRRPPLAPRQVGQVKVKTVVPRRHDGVVVPALRPARTGVDVPAGRPPRRVDAAP